MSKRLSYSANRVLIVGLILLSIELILAIIPTAVSSPGIAYSQYRHTVASSNQIVNNHPTSLFATENGFFSHVYVEAPLPFLRSEAAGSFNALRKVVFEGAGFDFLARVGDMLRVSNAQPAKTGVVFNSRHKKGEAFDYNQEDPRVVLVREYGPQGLHWRTYLVCQRQDGSLGMRATLQTDNAGLVSAYVFDFTAAAEKLGWERIPAQTGWSTEPTKKEFWHYQLRRTLQSIRPRQSW